MTACKLPDHMFVGVKPKFSYYRLLLPSVYPSVIILLLQLNDDMIV